MKRSTIAVIVLALAPVLVGGGLIGASSGATEQVSVDSAGHGGNEVSGGATISADGRYVAFESDADNLVPGDSEMCGEHNCQDAFVHDLLTGTTELVSVDSEGHQMGGHSRDPAISGDDRYVAFASLSGLWVRDRLAGTTELVSDVGYDLAISADGRYVAFCNQTSEWINQVFVYDRQMGATEVASVDSAGNQGNDDSCDPTIGADGHYVAFYSSATNLVLGDTNECGSPPEWVDNCDDIFVRDRLTAVTERVSVDSADNQGNDRSAEPAISGDGRYVAFTSWATNLVPNDTEACTWVNTRFNCVDIFLHDRQTGITERVNVDSAGNEASGDSGESGSPAISADGRYVAFHSEASNLAPGNTGPFSEDIFVHDRQTGVTELVSVDSAGNPGADCWSRYPAISADGRYVAFESCVKDLVPGDTNTCEISSWSGSISSYLDPGSCPDVFVHDRGPAPPPPTPTPPAGPYRTFAWGPGWQNAAWPGADDTLPRDAFACADGSYAAAYRYVEGGLERFFPGRPDISDMGQLNSHDAFLILITQPVTCLMPVAAAPAATRTLQWGVGWQNAGWSGADGTAPQDAFACAAGNYAATYRYVDGGLERFFPNRPDISDMGPLNKYDAFLILITQPVSCTMPIAG